VPSIYVIVKFQLELKICLISQNRKAKFKPDLVYLEETIMFWSCKFQHLGDNKRGFLLILLFAVKHSFFARTKIIQSNY